MKVHNLLLTVFALAAVGCHVNIDEPAKTADSTTKAPAKTTPVAKPTTPQTAKAPDTAPPPDPAEEAKKPGYNKNRLHQLSDLKTTTVTIGGHKLTAWVMNTDSLRQEGMMFVPDSDVTEDQAMLFVFTTAAEQGFWMHNTIMPLDIAYIGSDKKVVSASAMKPLDEKSVPSNGKAQYALEMKKGSIQRLGLSKGTAVDIPADVKADQ